MSIAETTTEPASTGTAASETAKSDAELTRDELFHVLQCRRRRLVLRYLHERSGDGPADMSDIAERIAALEHDTTVESLRSKERQRVYIALYQSHLPKMDDAGVIDYNQDRGLVEATPLADSFERYLDEEPSLLPTGPESPTEHESAGDDRTGRGAPDGAQWSNRYFGAAAVAWLAVGGLALSSVALPGTALALVVSSVFLALSLIHRLSSSATRSLTDAVS